MPAKNCCRGEGVPAKKRARVEGVEESLIFVCCECSEEIPWSKDTQEPGMYELRYGSRGLRKRYAYHERCWSTFSPKIEERHKVLLADDRAKRAAAKTKAFTDLEAVRRHSRSTRHQINNVHANSDEVVVASSDDGE